MFASVAWVTELRHSARKGIQQNDTQYNGILKNDTQEMYTEQDDIVLKEGIVTFNKMPLCIMEFVEKQHLTHITTLGIMALAQWHSRESIHWE